jgi:hypothetical protein
MTSEHQTAQEHRALARKLARQIDEQMLRLGNVLLAIHANQYWVEWGYDDWSDYVRTEIGMPPGSSYRLLAITRWIHATRANKATRQALIDIGRTKAYYITLAAGDPQVWIDKARKMTAEQLKSAIYSATGRWESKFIGFHVRRSALARLNRAIDIAKSEYTEPHAVTRGEALTDIVDAYLDAQKKTTLRAV